MLLDLQTDPDIKVSETFKEIKIFARYSATIQIQTFDYDKQNHESFQYSSGDLVYIISPLTSQLRTASRKVAIKYVGPLVIYKIVDPHNYLLMTLYAKILWGLFEHEILKPATIRTSHSNINSLVQLKQVLTLGMVI